MSALGIVFQYSTRTAVIHYRSCRWYREAIHKALPLTSRARFRFCRCCRPDPEDILADPPEVDWFEYGPGVVRRQAIPLEFAEKLAARRQLGIGRRNLSGRTWED